LRTTIDEIQNKPISKIADMPGTRIQELLRGYMFQHVEVNVFESILELLFWID